MQHTAHSSARARMDSIGPQARVHVYSRPNALLNWLHRATEACFAQSQHVKRTVSLNVATPQEAENKVQQVISPEGDMKL